MHGTTSYSINLEWHASSSSSAAAAKWQHCLCYPHKRHLNPSNCLSCVHECDRWQTDHATNKCVGILRYTTLLIFNVALTKQLQGPRQKLKHNKWVWLSEQECFEFMTKPCGLSGWLHNKTATQKQMCECISDRAQWQLVAMITINNNRSGLTEVGDILEHTKHGLSQRNVTIAIVWLVPVTEHSQQNRHATQTDRTSRVTLYTAPAQQHIINSLPQRQI